MHTFVVVVVVVVVVILCLDLCSHSRYSSLLALDYPSLRAMVHNNGGENASSRRGSPPGRSGGSFLGLQPRRSGYAQGGQNKPDSHGTSKGGVGGLRRYEPSPRGYNDTRRHRRNDSRDHDGYDSRGRNRDRDWDRQSDGGSESDSSSSSGPGRKKAGQRTMDLPNVSSGCALVL